MEAPTDRLSDHLGTFNAELATLDQAVRTKAAACFDAACAAAADEKTGVVNGDGLDLLEAFKALPSELSAAARAVIRRLGLERAYRGEEWFRAHVVAAIRAHLPALFGGSDAAAAPAARAARGKK